MDSPSYSYAFYPRPYFENDFTFECGSTSSFCLTESSGICNILPQKLFKCSGQSTVDKIQPIRPLLYDCPSKKCRRVPVCTSQDFRRHRWLQRHLMYKRNPEVLYKGLKHFLYPETAYKKRLPAWFKSMSAFIDLYEHKQEKFVGNCITTVQTGQDLFSCAFPCSRNAKHLNALSFHYNRHTDSAEIVNHQRTKTDQSVLQVDSAIDIDCNPQKIVLAYRSCNEVKLVDGIDLCNGERRRKLQSTPILETNEENQSIDIHFNRLICGELFVLCNDKTFNVFDVTSNTVKNSHTIKLDNDEDYCSDPLMVSSTGHPRLAAICTTNNIR